MVDVRRVSTYTFLGKTELDGFFSVVHGYMDKWCRTQWIKTVDDAVNACNWGHAKGSGTSIYVAVRHDFHAEPLRPFKRLDVPHISATLSVRKIDGKYHDMGYPDVEFGHGGVEIKQKPRLNERKDKPLPPDPPAAKRDEIGFLRSQRLWRTATAVGETAVPESEPSPLPPRLKTLARVLPRGLDGIEERAKRLATTANQRIYMWNVKEADWEMAVLKGSLSDKQLQTAKLQGLGDDYVRCSVRSIFNGRGADFYMSVRKVVDSSLQVNPCIYFRKTDPDAPLQDRPGEDPAQVEDYDEESDCEADVGSMVACMSCGVWREVTEEDKYSGDADFRCRMEFAAGCDKPLTELEQKHLADRLPEDERTPDN